jgi:hypothetical protein
MHSSSAMRERRVVQMELMPDRASLSARLKRYRVYTIRVSASWTAVVNRGRAAIGMPSDKLQQTEKKLRRGLQTLKLEKKDRRSFCWSSPLLLFLALVTLGRTSACLQCCSSVETAPSISFIPMHCICPSKGRESPVQRSQAASHWRSTGGSGFVVHG